MGPPRDIPWNQGPEEAAASLGERPPNIVLIVADDLGYNDISTFGGGVAGGRLQTPHIDALAAQGAVFTQSYSGSSTCATAVAAARRGLTDRKVRVDLDGGTLFIDWRDDGVWMTGPTMHVSTGVLTPEFIAANR